MMYCMIFASRLFSNKSQFTHLFGELKDFRGNHECGITNRASNGFQNRNEFIFEPADSVCSFVKKER